MSRLGWHPCVERNASRYIDLPGNGGQAGCMKVKYRAGKIEKRCRRQPHARGRSVATHDARTSDAPGFPVPQPGPHRGALKSWSEPPVCMKAPSAASARRSRFWQWSGAAIRWPGRRRTCHRHQSVSQPAHQPATPAAGRSGIGAECSPPAKSGRGAWRCRITRRRRTAGLVTSLTANTL